MTCNSLSKADILKRSITYECIGSCPSGFARNANGACIGMKRWNNSKI